MNEATVRQPGLKNIIKIHQANYAVYSAATEAEVISAVDNAIQQSSYFVEFFVLQAATFQCKTVFNPYLRKDAGEILVYPSSFDLVNFAETPAEPVITSIDDSSLPVEIKSFLSSIGCTQSVAIPIRDEVAAMGLILVAAAQDQLLTSETIDPLVHLARIVPLALNNIKSSHATRQRLLELETLAETSQAVSASNDLAKLYKLLHDKITTTIGPVDFALSLYNKQNETIEIPYAAEEGSIKSYPPFPLGEGVISILIRTRQPLMLVEDTERRMKALGAKVSGKPAKSWLGCPLVVASDAIGAIVIQDIEIEGRFTNDDLRLLIALSAQVAGAIYNIRLLDDARKSAIQLETVAEISREVSASLIVDTLLPQAVRLVQERFDFYFAAVFLVEPDGEYISVREASGEVGLKMKRAGYKLQVGSKSIIGTVTAQKEAQVVNDVSRDQNFLPNPLLPETHAEACLPLKVFDRILGVLDVQSVNSFVFTTENIKILQILADQLAVAVVNSELFAETQERLSQHRLLHHVTTAAASSTTIEEALNSAVQGLQVTLGGDQISIMMADKDQKNLEVKSSIGYPNEESAKLKIPFGVGVTGWVAARRQAQRIGDTTKDSRYIAVNPRVKSELAIPLIYRNEVLGVLNVESTRIDAYSENDEEMLGTLAGSLAAIIAHSRLLDQYRQQVERERLLYEITDKIRRTTNPEKILTITLDEVSKALNVRRAQIDININQDKQVQ